MCFVLLQDILLSHCLSRLRLTSNGLAFHPGEIKVMLLVLLIAESGISSGNVGHWPECYLNLPCNGNYLNSIIFVKSEKFPLSST